jgi:hypothetical protein
MMILRRSDWSLVKGEYELVVDPLSHGPALDQASDDAASTPKQAANNPFALRQLAAAK